jgi:hypothetical protein
MKSKKIQIKELAHQPHWAIDVITLHPCQAASSINIQEKHFGWNSHSHLDVVVVTAVLSQQRSFQYSHLAALLQLYRQLGRNLEIKGNLNSVSALIFFLLHTFFQLDLHFFAFVFFHCSVRQFKPGSWCNGEWHWWMDRLQRIHTRADSFVGHLASSKKVIVM